MLHSGRVFLAINNNIKLLSPDTTIYDLQTFSRVTHIITLKRIVYYFNKYKNV